MKRAIAVSCLFVLGLLLWVPSSFAANPWSGYWWPLSEGELIFGYKSGEVPPLQKYDQYAYGYHPGPATYESYNNGYNYQAGAENWFGLCNGWAAAAIMTKEPTSPANAGGIQFNVGDQKGLLSEAWYYTSNDGWFVGDRYGDGEGSEDLQDLYPEEVLNLLYTYVSQGTPFVMDLQADAPVWNYPVYYFEVSYSALGGGWYAGSLYIEVADDGVHPDYVGIQKITKTYTFNVYTEGGYIVEGYGYWTGNSQNDHPDFAWYPGSQPVLRNTSLDYNKIKEICGGKSGSNPVPKIRANGYSGSVTVSEGTPVSVTIGLDAGGWTGQQGDWWVLLYHQESSTWYCWIYGYGWYQGIYQALQYPFFSFGSFEVFNYSLSTGTYNFYFAVDKAADGELNSGYIYDVVQVNVTGGGGGPPGPATLIAPSGYITTTSPTFQWYAVSGATAYRLYLYDGLAQKVVIDAWVEASSVTSGSICSVGVNGSIGYSTDFQWWIQTYNSAGVGPWSNGLEFYNATY